MNEYKILSWNIDNFKTDYSENINQILKIDADFLLLQECPFNWHENFKNYVCLEPSKSHCGYTYLLIHKRIEPEILFIYRKNGIIISKIKSKINNNEMVIGSIHLLPYKENSCLRKKSIEFIDNLIQINKFDKNSIIIGGDCNMRDNEDNYIKQTCLQDIYQIMNSPKNVYHTWPNKSGEYKEKFEHVKPFRFDRIFISNFKEALLSTHETNYSDHKPIIAEIKI